MRGKQNNALTKELNFAWKPQQKYEEGIKVYAIVSLRFIVVQFCCIFYLCFVFICMRLLFFLACVEFICSFFSLAK